MADMQSFPDTEYPHVPAAFINAISEEGTKAEAVAFLQKQWNETCALRAELKALRSRASAPTPAHDATELLRHWQRVADKLQNGLRTSAGFETRASELAFKTFANVRQKTELALSDSSTDREGK